MHTLLPWGWVCCIFVCTVYECVQSKWGLQLKYSITKYTVTEKKKTLQDQNKGEKYLLEYVSIQNSTIFSNYYNMKIIRINRNKSIFLPDS